MKRVVLVGALVGCGSFQDPDIVLDLRILATTASVPEQMVDVVLAERVDFPKLLEQLVPSEVCVLIADPAEARRLRYKMTLCPTSADERCNSDDVQIDLASGIIDDPDTAIPAPRVCSTVKVDGNLLGVLMQALDGDPLKGLAGVDYSVTIQVGGEENDPALDLFGAKTLRVSPRIPATRTANTNPSLDRIEAILHPGDDDEQPPVTLPFGRCVDQAAPLELAPNAVVRLTPIEAPGAREAYVVPTLDGGTSMFTESLTYQWLTGNGHYSTGDTGGPHDLVGNPAPLFTDLRAPTTKPESNDPITEPTDVPLWIVQRDERFGSHWYESCIRVVP